MSWLFTVDWLLRCVTYFDIRCVSNRFRYFVYFRFLKMFLPFLKNYWFWQFLSLTTSLDKFSATTYITGIIHKRKQKYRGNAIVSTCILWYRENAWPREEDTKLCTNCILNLCDYDIHGIKLLSVKFYTFIRFIQVYMCVRIVHQRC
jgi:hypothetical protein